MSNPKILPECYGDTVLVESLGYKRPNHQTSGVGQVIRIMDEKFKNSIAVGVIDKDKKMTAKYYQQFVEIEVENGIAKMKHPDKKHFFITHAPLELFLINAANDVNIEITKYGFKDVKTLMKITKKINIGQNQQFKNFLNTLNQKNTPSFATMKKWLEEIVGEAY